MLRHRLVAHRGFQKKYPENTLVAMREAIEAGALYLETDIQLTADLQPVLYHDSFLSRVSATEGSIHDLTLSEAIALSASEPFRLGNRFPEEKIVSLDTFAGFIENHREVTVFLELKKESIARFGREPVYAAVSRPLSRIREQTVLISFDTEVISLARNKGFPSVGIVLGHWSQIDEASTQDIAPEYIFSSFKLLPADETLDHVQPLLVIYEINSPDRAIELFDRGADMVETFDIGGMIEALSSHSL